jgi:hypothetical protein
VTTREDLERPENTRLYQRAFCLLARAQIP